MISAIRARHNYAHHWPLCWRLVLFVCMFYWACNFVSFKHVPIGSAHHHHHRPCSLPHATITAECGTISNYVFKFMFTPNWNDNNGKLTCNGDILPRLVIYTAYTSTHPHHRFLCGTTHLTQTNAVNSLNHRPHWPMAEKTKRAQTRTQTSTVSCLLAFVVIMALCLRCFIELSPQSHSR